MNEENTSLKLDEDLSVGLREDGAESVADRLMRMAANYVAAYRSIFAMSDAQAHYLSRKIGEYLHTRNSRSDDLLSWQAREAISIENRLYPWGAPRFSLCVDGKTQTKLVASAHGGAIRTPVGDHADFLPDRNGKALFLVDGHLLRDILKWLARTGRFAWVLDSHLGCAARKRMTEDMRGSAGADDGRLDDVIRKKKMAAALALFAEASGYDGSIMPIQTCFDPHSGCMFMGVERDVVLADPRVVQSGLTENLLEELAHEGTVLSTRSWIVSGGFLYAIFSNYVFAIDYEADYQCSTFEFWTNMQGFSGDALPAIETEVRRVFGDLSDDEVRQRAILLMANAYTAFLHERRDGGNPYAVHDEEMIAVTMGDRGPYSKVHAFGVNPHHPDMPGTLKFVESLIRENRKSGRVMQISGNLVRECLGAVTSEFVQCAVPVAFFEVMDEGIGPELLDLLMRIDWTDLAQEDWMAWSRKEFAYYCRRKMPDASMGSFRNLFETFEKLRESAKTLFLPGTSVNTDLLGGRLLPLWIIRDHDRRAVSMVPFLAAGYSPE